MADLMDHWNDYVKELRSQCMDEGGFDLDFFLTAIMQEHPRYQWRSVTALAVEAFEDRDFASKEKVQRALDRLVAKGTVVQNNTNEEHFGLRTRIEKELGSHRINEYYTPFFLAPEPCPQPIKAAIAAGLIAPAKVEFYPIKVIDPNTFEVKALTRDDMFQETSKCLQEIYKIVARAEILNNQLADLSKK